LAFFFSCQKAIDIVEVVLNHPVPGAASKEVVIIGMIGSSVFLRDDVTHVDVSFEWVSEQSLDLLPVAESRHWSN
jgi:hypothetical protein